MTAIKDNVQVYAKLEQAQRHKFQRKCQTFTIVTSDKTYAFAWRTLKIVVGAPHELESLFLSTAVMVHNHKTWM